MAYEILTESYGRRLPKITAEADSTDDLATLGTNYAEGSTCVIGDKTYSLDKVQGWVEAGSGGGVAQIELTITEHTDDTVSVNKPFLQFLSELQAAEVDQGVEYGLGHIEVLATIIIEYSGGATDESQIILRPCVAYVTINSQNIEGYVLSQNTVELSVNMDNTEESPSMTIDKSGYLWYPVGDDTDTITKISGLYFNIDGYFD